MNRFSLFIFISSMIIALHSCKEQEREHSMVWHIAGEVPPLPGQEKAIGLAGPIAGISNGVLLLGGGANFPDKFPWLGGRKKYYDDGFVYSSNAEGRLQLIKRFSLPDTLAYAASVSTPEGVVIAGGENEQGAVANVFLAQWLADRDTVQIRTLPNLPQPLANSGIAARENTVYLVGGENAQAASSGFYALDIGKAGSRWETLPPLPYAVSHAVVVVAGKKNAGLYVLGGRKKNPNGISDLYDAVWRFDLEKRSWQQLISLPYALSAGTGAAFGEEAIYLFGGDRGGTFHKTEELIAAIQAATDPQQQQQLIDSKNELQESHPGFSNEILVYQLSADSWSVAGNIPFDTPVTTTAVTWNGAVILPSGEIRAGVRTNQILSVRFKTE